MPSRKRARAAVDRRGKATERTRTDRSLKAERKKTDQARRVHRKKAERAADGVVDQARSVADAVLTASRSKADAASPRKAGSKSKSAVAGERARADRVVRATRDSADDKMRGIRRHEAAALVELLVHERAATDADLLSERARSDAALAHRDDFLGIVAHDVRNLLNGVVLNLEVMRSDGVEAARADVAAERIRRAVARMTRLIGDLVDVTSINAGKLAMDRHEVDAGALVREATETFLPAAEEKGIALSADVPGAATCAELDRGRILQVLANLISNAIKFTPSGGTVTVGIEPGRSSLRFVVEDTGPGIPPALRKAVFERFRQVGHNDTRGQGLGLYISKSIVDAHGGRIRAESAPGGGTRLLFTLPCRSPRRRRTTRDASRRRSADRRLPPRPRRARA